MNICVVATLAVLIPDWRRFARRLFNRQFGWLLSVLFVFWTLVDQLAIRLSLWTFPLHGGTFPVRFLGLPVEEYAVFVVHTFLCVAALHIMKTDRETQ